MEMVHHLGGKLLGIVIFVLKDVVQGADEEEGVDGQVAAAFLEICPVENLVKDQLVVLPGGVVPGNDFLQPEVIAAILVHGDDILNEAEIRVNISLT